MYIPGAGWIGLDPTSGLFAGEGHIPLSATPHPSSAAPITGATEPCETTLDFSNTVTRVHEDPRVTLPYTDAAWDADLRPRRAASTSGCAAGDVRLTVGGEPTFVSVDNQVDAEWTTDADGPHKRRAGLGSGRPAEEGVGAAGSGAAQPGQVVSGRTVAALADRAALAHRRSAAVDRRRAAGRPVGEQSPQAGRGDADAAQQVLAAIADGLGLPPTQVRPAYEDALSRLAAAVRLPAGDPVDADDDLAADAAEARAALLARLDESGRPRRRPTCCRCTAATTTPAGPVPTGGCAAAASCCSTAIRRPGCGCRWTRSAGSRRGPSFERRPAGRARRALPVEPDTERRATVDGRPTTHRRPPRWSPRSATGCCTSSCRPPRSSSTSST